MKLALALALLLAVACGDDSHASDAGGGNGGAGAHASGGAAGASSGGSGGVAGSSQHAGGMSGGSAGVSGSRAGTGGVGGSDAGGVAGVGGAGGGAGGDGGEDGADAGTIECPPRTEPPTAGAACAGEGKCIIGEGSAGCSMIWECFRSKWLEVVNVGCQGPSGDLCPPSAADIEGDRCFPQACVYAPDIVCACEQPCGGIRPDPETLVMRCNPAPDAACVAEKQEGGACPVIGQTCSPACCGTLWTCTAQGWQAGEVFCPP